MIMDEAASCNRYGHGDRPGGVTRQVAVPVPVTHRS
jgi:hypothetical protein